MNFATDIMTKLLDGPADQGTVEGLALVETEVTKVIDVIKDELDNLKPEVFETWGEIQPTSFGDTERSPLLTLHHRRAHRVTYETLFGVRKDLIAFRTACAEARTFLQKADENAAEEAALTLKAVNRLVDGSTSSEGEAANNQAQQNGSGTSTDTSTGTGTGTDIGTDTGADTTGDTP